MNYTPIRNCLLLFLSFLCFNEQIFAQKSFSGIVKDSKGNTLEGAAILFKWGCMGTLTNEEGKFTVSIPDENISTSLIISYVGYQKVEIEPEELENRKVEVVLEEEPWIDCGLISVYNSIWKTDAGMSKKYSREVLRPGLVNLPELFISNTSSPNLTGGISLSQALYVLDGVPLPSMSLSPMGGNPLNYLTPGAIEAVKVSKRNAGIGMYGSQALNGVIEIQTKSLTDKISTLSYSGELGTYKGFESGSPRGLLQQQEINYFHNNEKRMLKGTAFTRNSPGFSPEQSSRVLGGTFNFSEKEELIENVTFDGQISYSNILEQQTSLAQNQDNIPISISKRNNHNYFSQLNTTYSISQKLSLSSSMSRFQHAAPYNSGLKGNFISSKLRYGKSYAMLSSALSLEHRNIAVANNAVLSQQSISLRASSDAHHVFTGFIQGRQEFNHLQESQQSMPSSYLSAGTRVAIPELSIDIACAFSRTQISLLGNAGVVRTPFLSVNSLDFGGEIDFGQVAQLSANYSLSSLQKIEGKFLSSSESLLLFPLAYDALENQGLSLGLSGKPWLGNVELSYDIGYIRENGLAKESMSLFNKVKWKGLSLSFRAENIRGWKLLDSQPNLFRLSDLGLSYQVKLSDKSKLKNLALSLSGQNLLLTGDQEVLTSQIELARARDPQRLAMPLVSNLLLGLKMNIL